MRQKQVFSVFSCAVVVAATFTACSGSDGTGPSGGEDAGAGSSSSSSGAAGSSSSSGAGGSSSSSSSGAGSSSSSSGAGSSSGDAGGPGADAGPGGGRDAGDIACGMGNVCEPPMECCTVRARDDAGMLMTTQTCVAAGACPMGGVVDECSSELSCAAGMMCCRGAAAGGVMAASTCEARCAAGTAPVCAADAGCPTGDMCVIPMGGAVVGVCRAAAPPPRDAGTGG